MTRNGEHRSGEPRSVEHRPCPHAESGFDTTPPCALWWPLCTADAAPVPCGGRCACNSHTPGTLATAETMLSVPTSRTHLLSGGTAVGNSNGLTAQLVRACGQQPDGPRFKPAQDHLKNQGRLKCGALRVTRCTNVSDTMRFSCVKNLACQTDHLAL